MLVLGCVVRASWCTDDDVDAVADRVVSSVQPLTWAFWSCPHLCSSFLQWFNSV